MNPNRASAARELLAFYSEAGVDLAVDETANHYLSPAAPKADVASEPIEPAKTLPSPGAPRNTGLNDWVSGGASASALIATPAQAAPLSPDSAVMLAREAARSAATLEELRTILESFNGCALKATATKLVFADGNPKARVMLVGEAPGYEEDRSGLPFVGRSGKLLDLMLTTIGLDRTNVYIANIVPWRPPGNRTPTPQEAAVCLPFMLRQIELCDPDVLVCLGGPSAQTLLGVKEGILKMRGRWFIFDNGKREIRAMPTLHPAYLLRSPIAKRLAWRDFLAIKKALATAASA
jgi:uracil-DNA glycosylase family 4